ncbi:MAG: GxxExxY protein, partial [Bacteroidetes bacterium]|nr:GxxExxY protein [Bacteroidota bacterium]
MTKKYVNDISYRVIGACIEVHKELGPGLLERIYQDCLAYEFRLRVLAFKSEFHVPIHYKQYETDAAVRCDFVVEDCLVVEIKSVRELQPIFEAQLLTYMKLLQKPKGILINFNSVNIFSEG